jgi:hypothetical protein
MCRLGGSWSEQALNAGAEGQTGLHLLPQQFFGTQQRFSYDMSLVLSASTHMNQGLLYAMQQQRPMHPPSLQLHTAGRAA